MFDKLSPYLAEFNIDRYNTFGFEDKVDDYPSNRLHADFLINLFDAVFKKKKEGCSVPHINVVSAGIMGVLKGRSSERWGTSCQNDFVVIEPNGSLNSCPNRTTFEQNSERIPHPLGWGMRGACCCLIYCLMMDSGAPPQDAAK